MYKIETRPTGYILTFSGKVSPNEMQNWVAESQEILTQESKTSFGVIIDMQYLEPIDNDVRYIMVNGQKLYKDKGMKNSAVILNNAELCQQFKNVALQSGIYATERYIDAQSVDDPVETAVKWVKDSIDPDE